MLTQLTSACRDEQSLRSAQVDRGTHKKATMLVSLLESFKKSKSSDQKHMTVRYDPNRIESKHQRSLRKEGHVLLRSQTLVCRHKVTSNEKLDVEPKRSWNTLAIEQQVVELQKTQRIVLNE